MCVQHLEGIKEQTCWLHCISILGQMTKLSQIADLPVRPNKKYPQCITTSSPLVPALAKGAPNSILKARNQKFWNYCELQVENAKWSTSQGGPLPDPLLYTCMLGCGPKSSAFQMRTLLHDPLNA